ncbi:hypothetical protein JTB14_005975 [Gonioctena quinquepunctata]|nr:hypothetical protein JTB14_005975 [Gonioctena quinquepunctata]
MDNDVVKFGRDEENEDYIIDIPSNFQPNKLGLGYQYFNSMKKYKDSVAQYVNETGDVHTYGELLKRCVKTALRLKERGLSKDDVIMLCSDNHGNSCVPFIAGIFLGIPVSSLDPHLSVLDTIHLLKQVTPSILFVVPSALELVESSLKAAEIDIEIVVFGESEKHTEFSEFLEHHKDEETFSPEPVLSLHETAVIFFSSGTTGLPKGIMISYYGLMGQADNMIKSGISGTVHLTYASLYWISTVLLLTIMIYEGGARVLCLEFDPEEVWLLLAKYRVTLLFVSPPYAIDMVKVGRPKGLDITSLQLFLTGGAPMPENITLKLRNLLPETIVLQAYGQTEVAGPLTLFKVNDLKESLYSQYKPKSVGVAVGGIKFKIVHLDTGKLCGPNEQGELRVKTKFVMNGYYNRDFSESFDDDGWLRTGDIVYYDEDKCFYVVDRIKEMLKYKSWHVAPAILEQLSLVEVHTVAELLQLCRQIEARKISIDSYSPPPKNRANLMEPDLASVKCILDFVLSHAQGDERPFVTVSIFGKELLGLLDSGASHTILGNKGWKLLKDIGLSTLDRTGVSSVTVANGDKCECLGVLHVPVRLKDSEKIIDILVVPDLSHTLILGVDFWVRMGIVPDLRSKEWKFTQVNGTFADINAVEALHSRELLTSDQVEILDELVNDCFVRMGNSLGCTKIVEHKIELLDNGEPIKQRFYPVSPALMKHIDGELQDMLKKDVIEPSSSPWSSPIVMHIKILSMVFERLISAGLTLSQEKCKFWRRELQFLGYVVDENGLHVDPGKVEVILQIPTPSKISEVRSLIGTASWYRRFIPNFSTVIQPLTELLKKNTKFVWTPRQEAALREVKEHLISAPVMACPNFDLPFIVQTDASGYGIGAVLTQNHPDVGERVVSYLSRSLTKQERKFSTTERECLAVIWSIEKLRPYIEGTHFTVVTDHWSLCWLNNLKDPTGRLGRWSLKLQQYSFDLVHRKGKENVVPDMLSRTVPIIDALDIAVNVDLGKSDKCVQFKKFLVWIFMRLEAVIPKNKRKDILLKCHDDPQAGHPGVFKTFKRVSEHFYWPKMKADISSHVKRCKVCCENKPEQRKPAGLLTPHRVVDRPFQLVCCDLIGPLPRSNRGFKFILVIVDNFSKFSLVIPLRNSTAKLVCTAVEDHLFLMFGPPKFLLSDNGSQFRSKEFKNLLANYAVKQIFTANYHAQANPTERVNKTLETMIRCYVSENHKEWDKMLSKVACAIRTQVHESMRRTPYFVVFGREFPMNLEIGVPDSSGDFTVDQEILARDRSVPLQQLYKEVKGKLLKAAERNKRYYDLRHRDVKYEVGDEVYRKNFVHSDAAKFYSSKLANKFVGPL